MDAVDEKDMLLEATWIRDAVQQEVTPRLPGSAERKLRADDGWRSPIEEKAGTLIERDVTRARPPA